MKQVIIPRDEYIELKSRESNIISFGNHNSKTGVACLNLAFPAILTCRADAPCKKDCYACHRMQLRTGVQAAYLRNYHIYMEQPDTFFTQMAGMLQMTGLKMVRLFDSGDFPNVQFLERICEFCKQFPDVKFMAFTKQYEMVNNYLETGTLPDNFNILFSAWDKDWVVPNPHNLGVAYVNFADSTKNPEIPTNAFKCPGRPKTCSSCGMCWRKNLKAVVFNQH